MDGWRIFKHSVNLVIANLETAFRLSIVLYLVQSLYAIMTFLNPPETVIQEGLEIPMMSPGDLLTATVFGVLAVIASLWIAVAWHRFVLMNETPRGWLPQFHGGPILSYLGRSILIGLIVALALMVVMIPLGIISIGLPALFGIIWVPAVGLMAYLFFRLGIILPAAAKGESMRLGDAWNATKGHSGTIPTLAIIVALASVVIELPSLFNQDPGSLINLIYVLVVNWFATIIGVSVLTTLYGHYVEGRPID